MPRSRPQARKLSEDEELANLRDTIRALDDLQNELVSYEATRRRDLNQRTREANEALAEERRRREAEDRAKELAANEAEANFHMTSALLVEDPAASINPGGSLRKDGYKGMSEAERAKILELQAAQREALEARRNASKVADIEYARTMHGMVKALDELEVQRDAFQKAQAKQAASILQVQMKEKRDRDARLKELYTNTATDDFFSQFGTSHR